MAKFKLSRGYEFNSTEELYEQVKHIIDAKLQKLTGYLTNHKPEYIGFTLCTWYNTNHFGWPRSSTHIDFEIELVPIDLNHPAMILEIDSGKRALVLTSTLGCLLQDFGAEDHKELGLVEFEERDRIWWNRYLTQEFWDRLG